MFKLLGRLGKKDWLYIFFALVLIVMQVWLDLTMPDYTKKLTSSVVSTGITMNDVLTNGGMMLLCAMGSMICSFICSYFTVKVASSFSKETRATLFNKISSFSPIEMKNFSTASLITRTTNDVTQMQNFIAMGLQLIIKAPILAIWAICKISASSVEWTMATIVCVIVIVFTIGIIVALCLPKFKKIQTLTDNLNGVTRESVSGVRVVRAFNAERYQEEKFDKANTKLTNNQLFTSKATGIMMPIISTCMNGLSLAIYWIGAYLIDKAPIIEKSTLIGNMTSFTQYALQVVLAFMMLVVIFVVLPRSMVSAKRINEVLDTKISLKEGNIDEHAENKGEVEFKNVSFGYSGDSNYCLDNISFKVNRGETLAIIGATGSGKTSLINLIPRFFDPQKGEVLVDGINVKDYKLETLNEKVAVVPQKAVLFKGDIKSNIIYGKDEDIKDDDIRISKALKIAKADFVENLDEGINSQVAQGGTNFSGGQKQRLSIARAIFKDAEIIIFDDSFSALDYKTDMEVRQNIRKELKDKTVVIVAQRIGTIKNADKILVLEDGKIVGEGKHEQLLQNCEIYKEIALSQLSKEEL